MTTKRAIEMIDEYLLEDCIDKDWVEILCMCKQALNDNAELHEMNNALVAAQKTLHKCIAKQNIRLENMQIELQAMRGAANSYKLELVRLQNSIENY